MELIFILTYNCNYRCRYCDIDKRNEDISKEVIDKSLVFLKKHNLDIKKTKFFGGEPTLQLESIFSIIQELSTYSDTQFYLTTNGSLINNSKIELMKQHKIISTLSLDGNAETTDENRVVFGSHKSLYSTVIDNITGNENFFRINQVITPKSVDKMVENFIHLYNLGFRNFNFLPEYYVEWSKKSLLKLHEGFEKIQKLDQFSDIYLVNSENYSPTSFFNVGIVIDTDGSIYGTNLILAGRFEKYKSELRIGSVFDENFTYLSSSEIEIYLKKIEYFLELEYSKNVLRSVFFVNKILSNFTLNYGK